MNFNTTFGLILPRWARFLRWWGYRIALDDAIRSGNSQRQRKVEVLEIRYLEDFA